MKSERLKKLMICVISVVMTAALFSSCSKGGATKTTYEKIIDKLKNMQSFEAEAYVRYISNNGTNTYITLQQARSSGAYRIEVTSPEAVAGNVTVFDGKVISQYNKKVDGRVSVGSTESMERVEILLTSFVKNYLNSDESAMMVSKTVDADETVIEAVIPGSHRYMATEKLWVDNKTLKPTQLIVYDKDQTERIIVSYRSFEYNVKLDDSIFVVQK